MRLLRSRASKARRFALQRAQNGRGVASNDSNLRRKRGSANRKYAVQRKRTLLRHRKNQVAEAPQALALNLTILEPSRTPASGGRALKFSPQFKFSLT